MNKIIFTFVFFVSVVVGHAQSSIEIYTNDNNAAFRAFLNGKQFNNFHQTHIRFDSLETEVYQVRLSFQGDSIADIVEDIKLFPNDSRTYRVEQIDKVNKGFSKVGRKLGKLFRKEKENSDSIYIERYFLRDVSVDSPFQN